MNKARQGGTGILPVHTEETPMPLFQKHFLEAARRVMALYPLGGISIYLGATCARLGVTSASIWPTAQEMPPSNMA